MPSPNGMYRDNPDTHVNSHSKFLAEIGKSFDCFPFNNLTYKGKNFDGKFSYYKGDKKLQNDIVLGNRKALKSAEKSSLANMRCQDKAPS